MQSFSCVLSINALREARFFLFPFVVPGIKPRAFTCWQVLYQCNTCLTLEILHFRGNSSMIYLIRTFVNATVYPPPSTTAIITKKEILHGAWL
jgi:hypothetical protein